MVRVAVAIMVPLCYLRHGPSPAARRGRGRRRSRSARRRVDPGLDPLEVEVDRHAVEKGEPAVSLGAYATVLFVLGFAERLGDLADPGTDELGLALEGERLPQRIRRPRKPAQGTPGGASLP